MPTPNAPRRPRRPRRPRPQASAPATVVDVVDVATVVAMVDVEPSGLRFPVAPGQTVMAAARAAGLFWPNQCNMACQCASCFMILVQGAEHCSPMGRAEAAALREQRGQGALAQPVRLACQTRIRGPIRVRKVNVRQD